MPRPTIILAKTAAQFLILSRFSGRYDLESSRSYRQRIQPRRPGRNPGGDCASRSSFRFSSSAPFINLGLLVSALTRQAVSSFIILLLCWVFLFGVFPRLSVVISQLISPVKSQQLVLQERNRVRLENEKARSAEIAKIVESGDNTQEKQDAVSAEFRAKLTEAFQKLDREQGNRQNAQMNARRQYLAGFARELFRPAHGRSRPDRMDAVRDVPSGR